MKTYKDYEKFRSDYDLLVYQLRWSQEDPLVNEQTISSLAHMQALNPEFSERYEATECDFVPGLSPFD